MEAAASKQNSRDRISGETAIVANTEEPVVSIPVIVPPIEVQAALGIVPAEVRNPAAAIDLAHGAETDDRELPLLFGIFGPVSQNVLDLARLPRILDVSGKDFLHRIFRRDVAVEVEDCVFELHLTFADNRKPFGGDVVIFPIIITCSNHRLESHVVVNDVTA